MAVRPSLAAPRGRSKAHEWLSGGLSPQEVRVAVEALARRRAVVQQRLLMKVSGS
jgi:hypothetical protein